MNNLSRIKFTGPDCPLSSFREIYFTQILHQETVQFCTSEIELLSDVTFVENHMFFPIKSTEKSNKNCSFLGYCFLHGPMPTGVNALFFNFLFCIKDTFAIFNELTENIVQIIPKSSQLP